MVRLQQLVEKQNKNKKVGELLKIITGIVLAYFLIIVLLTAIFDVSPKIPIINTCILIALAILNFVNILRSDKINSRILQHIEDVLDSNLENNLNKSDFVLVHCVKSTEHNIYFSALVYSNNISYEQLTNLPRPLVTSIEQIIHKEITIYYYIEADEEG